MDREKLIRVVLESEKELYLEEIRDLSERVDYPDSFFLTELSSLSGDLDWSIGSPASKCFEENEVIRSPEEEYVGSYRDVYRDLVRFINYRGDLKDSDLKTRDRAIEFRASDVNIPKDFNEYKKAIKTYGSRLKVHNYGITSEWRIDSDSDVEIVNEKEGWSSFDNIAISIVGNNSEFVFRNEVFLETDLNINLILYGDNNKVIIDMDNFGIKSGVNVKRLSFAKNNEVVVRHMIPEFVEVEEDFTDNNNNLKIEKLHDY